MADFIQALDPSKLVLVETVLSFITSPFAAPSYNLPIFLFGTYAQEHTDAVQSLQTFTFLVAGSIIFDIIYMARNQQNWLIRTLTIIIQLLKVPTCLAFLAALRQRGAQFAGLSFAGDNLAGATVWSMPGGFTSNSSGREGYQAVDEPAVTTPRQPTAPPAASQNAPGAYHSV